MERVHIGANVADMQISAIKEMAMRSARVPGAASLAWGLPSFRTPEHIRAHVAARLIDDREVGRYALPDGLPELRASVVQAHQRATGVAADADQHVLVTAGNMQGINALLHVLLDPGDELIVTDPGFASHVQQAKLCGGKVVYWPLREEAGWQLDVDALPDLIGPRTRAILLVSPSNPTGSIFAKADLVQVCNLARERGVLLLVDDPYHHFCYENANRYFNPASAVAQIDHVIYLFSFSKAHAMSGWRLGYMIVPAWLKREVLKVHDATLICAPRISQQAGIAALTLPPIHLPDFQAALARRRDLICERLDAVPHVFGYLRPDGAYYVFPRLRVPHADSVSWSIELLERDRVTVTPGRAFGPQGEHHVRMAYCVDDDVIDLAFDRIEARFGRG